MTKLLNKAIEAVRVLAPEEQDEIARMMLAQSHHLEDEEGGEIDSADLDAIDRGLENIRRQRIATADEIKAAYRSFRK